MCGGNGFGREDGGVLRGLRFALCLVGCYAIYVLFVHMLCKSCIVRILCMQETFSEPEDIPINPETPSLPTMGFNFRVHYNTRNTSATN